MPSARQFMSRPHEEGKLKRGEVYGVIAHPFAQLAEVLRAPRAWCAIALLHLNIKTCTYERADGRGWLNFYSGRKFYEPPEKNPCVALRLSCRIRAPITAGDTYGRNPARSARRTTVSRSKRLRSAPAPSCISAMPTGRRW